MLTRLNFKLQNPPKPLDLQGSVTDQLSQLQDYINQSGKLSYDQARSIQKYLDDLNEKGALTISANSLYSFRGLQFPTAQGAAVADVNTLDDYAEGSGTLTVTFATPGTSSFAATENNYTYTKVGREVCLRFNIVGVITIGTAAGDLTLSGLPFTNANVASNYAVGSVLWGDNMSKTGYTQMVPIMAPNASSIVFAWTGAGKAGVDVAAADITTGSTLRLRGSVTFHV